jgi:DNA-binding Lrp family transcriptional regulator
MTPPRKPSSLEYRLRRIMLEGGFRSIRSLAEGCGLAPATLAKRIQKERESGSAKIDGHTIQRVAQKTGFSAHWIMTGEGSPYGGGSGAPHPDDGAGLDLASHGPGGARLGTADDASADGYRSIEWGREVVEALVRQGIASNRARQTVGALLLEAKTSYSGILELYQASLDRLGYTHAALKKEAPSETRIQSRAPSQPGAHRNGNAGPKQSAGRAKSKQGKP